MARILVTPSKVGSVAQEDLGPTVVRIGLGGSSPGVSPQGGVSNIFGNAIAAVPIGGHRVVASNYNGELIYASSAAVETAHRVRGIVSTAYSPGATCQFQIVGEIEEPSWNWNVEIPLWLGPDGQITQTVPSLPSAKFSLQVGFPVSSKIIQVSIGYPIFLE